MDELTLALDFGGTKLSAALFEREPGNAVPLRITARRRVYTPPGADAPYELAAMLSLARAMLAGRAPTTIGASFGGPVDYSTGVVRLSHHVRGWESFPLRERLAAEFGAPAAPDSDMDDDSSVYVDNDANAAAWGEHLYGAGRGVADLLYITVSTGVGGGWILGGRLWRGHEGLAGEIGHTVVDPAGPLCLCGKRGCVERLASGPYMAADWEEGRGSRGAGEKRRGGEGGQATGKEVAEAAVAGEGLARAILLRGARALGVGIGNAANLINPQRFILGGGVTNAGEIWWAEVRRAAHATALPEVVFDIVPAGLGDDAPLWGAAGLRQLAGRQ